MTDDTSAARHLVRLTVFALITTSGLSWAQDCSPQSIFQCLRAFSSVDQNDSSTVIILNDYLPSWNETLVTKLCLYYPQYANCMKSVNKNCSLSVQQSNKGIDDAFTYLCDSIPEYSNYSLCFGGSGLRTATNFCNETLNTKTASLLYLQDETQKTTLFCSYTDEFVSCLSAAVKPVCGSSANIWHQTYVHKLISPYLAYLICPGWTQTDTQGSTWPTATIVICALIVSTLFLMLVVIAVFTVVIQRRRKLLARSTSRRRSRRSPPVDARQDSDAGCRPPDYNAPYVVYGMPGPDGERRLRIIGLGDGVDEPLELTDISAFPFKGIQPPPYADLPPPAFDEIVASSSAQPTPSTSVSPGGAVVNDGFVADSSCSTGNTSERPADPALGGQPSTSSSEDHVDVVVGMNSA